jgi:hypothetical protein
VLVEIEQVDTTATVKDPVTRDRAPKDSHWGKDVRDVRKRKVTLPGQVERGQTQAYSAALGGMAPKSDGHILFLVTDLAKKNLTLGLTDVIVRIAGKAEELTIVEVRPQVHYNGRPWMMMAMFLEKATGV